MKKFLKWFIGLIIGAAIAYGVYTYTDWFKCDTSCETPVTEVPTDAIEREADENMVEIDTMIVDTAEEVADTIQNTPVEIVNE